MERIKRTISVVGSAFLLATALVITAPVTASAGQIGFLDRTFGVGGMVSTPFISNVRWGMGGGPHEDSANAVALQDDGKIVAAGSAGCRLDFGDPGCSFGIVRYDRDGSLDPTFGNAGKVKTRFVAGAQAYDVVIQGDGKIVVAGTAWRSATNSNDFDVALARYDTDGALDPTFGGDGMVTADVGGEGAAGVAIRSDGEILTAGWAGLALFTTSGALDPSFGVSGVQTKFKRIADVAFSGDRILIAQDEPTWHAFVVRRLDTGGKLDPSFGDGGVARASFGRGAASTAQLALRPGGRIVVVGYHRLDFVYSIAMARFTSAGAIDTAFGRRGTVTTQAADGNAYQQSVGRGLAIQPDGAIVVAAGLWDAERQQDNAQRSAFGIVRYRVNGSLDRRFSGDGKLVVDFGQAWDFQQATSAAIAPSGAIVVAGESPKHSGDFGVVRIVVPANRPDAIIGLVPYWRDTAWGDDLYDVTGRSQVWMDSGLPGAVKIAVQNDGSATDTFTVRGCSSTGGIRARYSRHGVDITRGVVAGTYRLGPVAPGGVRYLLLRFTKQPGGPPTGQIRCRVVIRSMGDERRADAVLAVWTIQQVGCLTQKIGTGRLLGCELR